MGGASDAAASDSAQERPTTMLEQYVSNFLAGYLGKYIRGINDKQLGVSLWNGSLDLKNLELRTHMLVPSALPVVCHRGYVGALKVTIPWTRLQSEPVVISLSDIYVLLRPKRGAPWDASAEEEAERDRKNRALDVFEALRQKQADETPQDHAADVSWEAVAGKSTQGDRGFFGRVQDGIANNVQILVNRVHIRFEDSTIDPRQPVAAGFTLDKATCVSTNQQWAPGYVRPLDGLLHKLLTVEGWSAYLCPCSPDRMLINRFPSSSQCDDLAQSDDAPLSDIWAAMQAELKSDSVQGSHIVEPSTMTLKLRWQSGKLQLDSPRVASFLSVSSLRFKLSRLQYEHALSVAMYVANFEGVDKFRQYRPSTAVAASPADWWRYAYNCVLRLVREKKQRRRISWQGIQRVKQLGRNYADLWKRRQDVPWLPSLTEAELSALDDLHAALEAEQLIWYRKIAYSELKVDALQRETQRKLVQEKLKSKSNLGWMGWAWTTPEPADLGLPDANNKTWSAEERQQLAWLGLRSIDEGDKQLPAGYVATTTLVQIDEGEALLSHSAKPGSAFAALKLEKMKFKLDSMPDAFKAIVSLGSIDVRGTSRAGVSPNQKNPFFDSVVSRSDRGRDAAQTDLLLCVVERNPLDERASLGIDVSMAPVDVVVHPVVAANIASFFRPPASIDLELVPSVSENLRIMAQKHLLKSAATDLSLRFASSTFVLPFSKSFPEAVSVASERYPCPHQGAMVLTFGSCVLQTDVTHAAARARRLDAGTPLSVDDYYERYNFILRSIQASIAPSSAEYMAWWAKTRRSASGPAKLSHNSEVKEPRIECMRDAFEEKLVEPASTNDRKGSPRESVPGGCPEQAPVKEFIPSFDMSLRVDRYLDLAVEGDQPSPAVHAPLMRVTGELPSVLVRLSRQNLLVCLHSADVVAKLAARLSPQLPEQLEVDDKGIVTGLGTLLYEQMHHCRISSELSSLLSPSNPPSEPPANPPPSEHHNHNDAFSLSPSHSTTAPPFHVAQPPQLVMSPPATPHANRTDHTDVPKGTPAVVILRKGMLLVYTPAEDKREGTETSYALETIFNLKAAPFRTTAKGLEVTVLMPQAYGPPKRAEISVSDAGQCRALYQSLHKIAAEAQSLARDGDDETRSNISAQLHLDFRMQALTLELPSDEAAPPTFARSAKSSESLKEDSPLLLLDEQRPVPSVRRLRKRPSHATLDDLSMSSTLPKLSDTPDAPDRPAQTPVTMAFSGFQMKVDMRHYDQKIYLKLASLECRDREGNVFCSSIIPQDADGDASARGAEPNHSGDHPEPDGTALIEMACLLCAELSPHWTREGPDVLVNLTASTLNVSVTPGLAEMAAHLYDLLGVNKVARDRIVKEVASAPAHLQPARGVLDTDPERLDVALQMSMAALKVTCCEEVAPGVFEDFAAFVMEKAEFTVKTCPLRTTVVGKLGNAVANEVVADENLPGYFHERPFLGMADSSKGSLIQFSYRSDNIRAEQQAGAYVSGCLDVTISQIQSTFHFSMLQRILAWSSSGYVLSKLKSIPSRTLRKSSAHDSIESLAPPPVQQSPTKLPPGILQVNVAMLNPLVALPPVPGDTSYLLAQLGNVSVTMGIARSEQGTTYASTALSLANVGLVCVRNGAETGRIAEGLHVAVTLSSALSVPVGDNPVSSTHVDLGDMPMVVDESAWGLLLQVAAKNILSPYKPRYAPPAEAAPQPPIEGNIKSELSVRASCLRLLLKADQQAPFASIDCLGMSLLHRDLQGGVTKTAASLDSFSVNDLRFAEPKPLLDCSQEPSAPTNLEPAPTGTLSVCLEKSSDRESTLTIRLGEPTIYLDSEAIIRVQDHLMSPPALEAVNTILKPNTDSSAPTAATDMTMYLRTDLRHLTVVALETKFQVDGGKAEFFRLTATNAVVEGASCASGLRMRASLGDLRMCVYERGVLTDVLGMPPSVESRATEAEQTSFVSVEYRKGACRAGPAGRGQEGTNGPTEPAKGEESGEGLQPVLADGYAQHAAVRLQGVRVVAFPGFWQRVGDWLSAGPLSQMADLGTTRAERLAKSRMQATKDLTQVDLRWSGPHVIVPCGDGRALTATLGCLSVSNRVAGGKETFDAALQGLRVHHDGFSINHREPHLSNRVHNILRDFDATATLSRLLPSGSTDTSPAVNGSEPSLFVALTVGRITLQLDNAQVGLLLDAVEAQGQPAQPQKPAAGAPVADRAHVFSSEMRSLSSGVGAVRTRVESTVGDGGTAAGQQRSGFAAEVAFEGMRVALLTAAGSPLEDLAAFDMTGVLVRVNGDGITLSLESVTVRDSTPAAHDHARDVVSTIAKSHRSPSHPTALPCFEVLVRGDALELQLRRLHLLAVPSFVAQIARFNTKVESYRAQWRLHRQRPQPATYAAAAAQPPLSPRSVPAGCAEGRGPATRYIRASMDEFTLGVVDGEMLLTTFELDASRVQVELPPDAAAESGTAFRVTGGMGSLRVVDRCVAGTVYGDVVGPTKVPPAAAKSAGEEGGGSAPERWGGGAGDLVEFSYRNFDVPTGCDTALSLTLRSLHFVHSRPFLAKLAAFVAAGGLSPMLPPPAHDAHKPPPPQPASEPAGTPRMALHFVVTCINPILIFPESHLGASAVVADLGEVTLRRDYQPGDRRERVMLQLMNMALATRQGGVAMNVVHGANVVATATTRVDGRRQSSGIDGGEESRFAGGHSGDHFSGRCCDGVDRLFELSVEGAEGTIEKSNFALLLRVAKACAQWAEDEPAAAAAAAARADRAAEGRAAGNPLPLEAAAANGGDSAAALAGTGSSGHPHDRATPHGGAEQRPGNRNKAPETLRATVRVPVVSLTVCDTRGSGFAGFSVRDVHVRYDSGGDDGTATRALSVSVREVDLRQVFEAGAVKMCRDLCFSTDPPTQGGGPADCPVVRVDVKTVETHALSETSAVLDVRLPHFLFIPPLLVQCHESLFAPYSEVFCDNPNGSAAAASVEVADNLPLAADLFVTPKKQLLASSSKRNCIDIGNVGDTRFTVHLIRRPGDARKLIHLEKGLTVRFVDVTIKLYGGETLDDFCSYGEGSYACKLRCTEVRCPEAEAFREQPSVLAQVLPDLADHAAGGRVKALRHHVDARFNVSFGVGIGGSNDVRGVDEPPQRCVMLSGNVRNGVFSKKTVLDDPPEVAFSLAVDDFRARHLSLPAPRRASDRRQTAPRAADAANLLDPCRAELSFSPNPGGQDSSRASPRLQVLIDASTVRLCVGDAQLLASFLKSIPASEAPARAPAPVARWKPGGAAKDGRPEREDAGGGGGAYDFSVSCGGVSVQVIDDRTATPLPLASLGFSQAVVSGRVADGRLAEVKQAAVETDVQFFNADECKWVQLVEPFVTHAAARFPSLGGTSCAEGSISLTKVEVCLTPVFLRAASRFGAFFRPTEDTPLRARSMYVLRNESGRQLAVFVASQRHMLPGFGAANGGGIASSASNRKPAGVTLVDSDTSFEFDSPSSDVVHVVVVRNPTVLDGLLPPPQMLEEGRGAAGLKPWMTVPVGVVGIHRLPDGFVAEVANADGRKTVHFRTSVLVVNHLSVPVLVEGVRVAQAATAPRCGTVKPGVIAVPHDRLSRNDAISVAPLNGQYRAARLGFSFAVLRALPAKWTKYLVRCVSEAAAGAGPSEDFCFQAEVVRSARDTVSLVFRPLLVIENRLPVDLRYNLAVDDGELALSGSVAGMGGRAAVHKAVGYWPHCMITLKASCTAGGKNLRSKSGAVVWAGPSPLAALAGRPTRASPATPGSSSPAQGMSSSRATRAAALAMTSSDDSEVVAHLEYSATGSVVVYVPFWAVNKTDHSLEVFAENSVCSTILSAATADQVTETPCPISPQHEVGTLYLKFVNGTDPIPLDISTAMEGSARLVLPSPQGEGLYRHMGVAVDTITWPSSRAATHVIRFVPRWFFHNETQHEVTVRVVLQYGGTRPSFNVKQGKSKSCCSSGRPDDNVIEVKYVNDTSTASRFSRAFSISTSSDLYLRLNYDVQTPFHTPGAACFGGPTNPDGSNEYFRVLRATTAEASGTLNVTFRECHRPPFFLENRSSLLISFVQADVKPAPLRHLPARTTIAFAADDPCALPLYIFRVHASNGAVVAEKTVRLDVPTKDGEKIDLVRRTPLWYRIRHSSASMVSMLTFAEEHYLHRKFATPGEASFRSFDVKAQGLGVALCIPTLRKDICHFSLSGIGILLNQQESETALSVGVADFQLDDEGELNPQYPVVLRRMPESEEDENAWLSASSSSQTPRKRRPMLAFDILQSTPSPEVLVLRDVRFEVAPLQARITDTFISNVMLFFETASAVQGSDSWDGALSNYWSPAPSTASFSDRKAFLSSLIIRPIAINVSFIRQLYDPAAPFNQFHSKRWWLGYLIRSVDNVNLVWDTCTMTDSCEPLWVIGGRLRELYMLLLRDQFPKILFSMSSFGNPAALVRGVGQGLSDFLTMPFTEARKARNVEGVVTGGIIGALQGATSLVTKTGSGLAGSASSLSRSMAKLTSKLSFDPAWIADRQTQHAAQMHEKLSWGVYDGARGFFSSTVSGFRDDGLTGATAGLARGTAGLFAKPATGVLDLISDALETVAGRNSGPGSRVREPKTFPKEPSEVDVDLTAREAEMLSMCEQLVARWRAEQLSVDALKKMAPSWEILARCTSWDEFHALCTPKEFYEQAHHARDAFLAQARPCVRVPDAHMIRAEERVRHLAQTYRLEPRQLATDTSLQVSPAELSLVTTWDQFRALLSEDQFYLSAHHARDRCLLSTTGFQCL
ncbi:putative vacuolar protein sorting-associated protein 13A [Diplonema papillatum]|nr:putative vacuolar protein sorting-associated protein 13A [Diplonema papillatum]